MSDAGSQAVGPSQSAQPTSLAELTTMRVGGPADNIIVAHTRNELAEHAQNLWDSGEEWLLLGGGSNTVVNDDGFPGTVLLIRGEGIEFVEDPQLPEQSVRLRVQAGHDWDALVAASVERGWSGIEALSGIPGRAGAAPIQNIGAYGAEISDVLHSIEFLDFSSREILRLSAAELELSYRNSVIKEGRAGVVLSIDLVLDAHPELENPMSAPVRYGQLADALGITVGQRVSLRELRRTVLRLRASKGMVLDRADHDTWSAGSFFTNPIVSERFARELPASAPKFPVGGSEPAAAVTSFEELDAGLALRLPQPAGERRVKLSAAWLIENSGVTRGFRLPGSGAAISSEHPRAGRAPGTTRHSSQSARDRISHEAR